MHVVTPGAILTKLDGDTRGGAALSVRGVSGKPIKVRGVGVWDVALGGLCLWLLLVLLLGALSLRRA